MTDVAQASPAVSTAAAPAPVPEQRAAIDDRERDLFLAAGAGTGKTTVLVERFCDAVCATSGEDADVGMENVLAFTFTERAAGELKRRIRTALMQRADRADGAEARRLRRMARESDSAWISTIHSFCRRVLASHPLSAGLDPGFRVLDEAGAARVAGEAFDSAFARFCALGDDRFEVAAAYRVPGLRDMVRAAHDELRARGEDDPALPALEPPDVAGAIAALRTAASEALTATAEAKRTKKVDDCRARIAEALAVTEGGGDPSEEEVEAWAFNGKMLSGAEGYQDACAALRRRLVEARFAHQYEHIRELLGLYADEYRRRKEERSALDFEDLQLRARRLLKERPQVRRAYQRQFRHLMVDEFQDTNALQLSLVRLLHLEDGSPRNRLFTVGDDLQSIYGFRHADVEVFRRERAATERRGEEEAGARRLSGNFRSAPAVLALVNRVGGALFGSGYQELAAGAPPSETGAVELLVTEQKGWDVDGVSLDVSPDERAQPWRVAEAQFLAERLRKLHQEGVPRGDIAVLLRSFSYVEAYEDALRSAGLEPYVVGGRGYWSKQQVSDVRNLLACVANPLDEKALFGALASPACGVTPDALWLLRAAASGAPVWSVLRWAYGPAPETDDGAVGDDRSTWSDHVTEVTRHVPEPDSASLREFTATLLEVRSAAPGLSLEALVDRVITATGYDLALLMRPKGRRRMANVRKLMRLAREFEAEEGRDLRGFLDSAAAAAEVEAREAEAAVDAEGHDGVRLMTVHAAKGLEFPVVAVADLGRRLSSGPGPPLRIEPATEDGGDERADAPAARVGLRLARLGKKGMAIFDYAELQDRAVEREREEERRILHVAMTRAERRLVLSGAIELEKLHDEPKPTEPLLAPVLRALGWSEGETSVELAPPPLRPGLEGRAPSTTVEVRVRRPEDAAEPSAAEPAELVDDAVAAEAHPLADPDLAPLPAAPPALVRSVSYSSLSLYERCGYRFYAERVLGMRPRAPGPGNGAAPVDGAADAAPGDERHPAAGEEDLAGRYGRGRVVHELLERSARTGWSAPDPGHVAELLRREEVGAGTADVRRAAALVEGFLEAPIRRRLDAARSILPEAPFAFRAGNLVVRGEIDLLADLGDEVLVIDYKSDALGGAEPAAHMDRYDVQRRIYALAALRRYGRPVTVAYVFLERPAEPVEAVFGVDAVTPLGEELARLTAGISAGRFDVTDSPELPLCFDCPARERLCVHGPERTLR